MIETEWSLNQDICEAVFHQRGWPNIDLFATWENKCLLLFFFLFPDPKALGVNALAESWRVVAAYAYPLITLRSWAVKDQRGVGNSNCDRPKLADKIGFQIC